MVGQRAQGGAYVESPQGVRGPVRIRLVPLRAPERDGGLACPGDQGALESGGGMPSDTSLLYKIPCLFAVPSWC